MMHVDGSALNINKQVTDSSLFTLNGGNYVQVGGIVYHMAVIY